MVGRFLLAAEPFSACKCQTAAINGKFLLPLYSSIVPIYCTVYVRTYVRTVGYMGVAAGPGPAPAAPAGRPAG